MRPINQSLARTTSRSWPYVKRAKWLTTLLLPLAAWMNRLLAYLHGRSGKHQGG